MSKVLKSFRLHNQTVYYGLFTKLAAVHTELGFFCNIYLLNDMMLLVESINSTIADHLKTLLSPLDKSFTELLPEYSQLRSVDEEAHPTIRHQGVHSYSFIPYWRFKAWNCIQYHTNYERKPTAVV